jgi:nitrogen fixation NifU-like protein
LSDTEPEVPDDVGDAIQAAVDRLALARYSRKVMNEFKDPSNVGRMPDADGAGVLTGTCGDTMEIYLRIDGGVVTDTTFMTDGCGPTIACGSMLTKMVRGNSLEFTCNMTDGMLIEALDGLPEENVHCARLTVAALHKAIEACLER